MTSEPVYYTRERTWKGWAGELSEIEEAARVALHAVETWQGSQPTCRVTLRRQNLTAAATALDFLSEVPSRDLPEIESVDIDIAEWPEKANFRVRRSVPTISYEIRGPSRGDVEGLAAQLDEILGRGARQPRWYDRNAGAVIGVLLGGGLMALIAVALGPVERPGREEGIHGASFLGLAAGVVIGLVLYWASPDLQLLPGGGQTRWRRFRPWILSLVVGVVGSILATVVVAALD